MAQQTSAKGPRPSIFREKNQTDESLSRLVTNNNFYRAMMVQDIPDAVDAVALWKMFKDFGEIEKLWLHAKNKRNRFGRATIIFADVECAELAEAIMNETECAERTLQVFIGVAPSERAKAKEKREKERMQRRLAKAKQNQQRREMRELMLERDRMNGYPPFGYGPPRNRNQSFFF